MPLQTPASWHGEVWVLAATQDGVLRSSWTPHHSPGRPGVLGEPAVRTIQGSDPVQSQSSCPSKHCEPPTGHWAGRSGTGSGAYSAPAVSLHVAVFAASLRPAFLPGTASPASSWGKQWVGRKQVGPPPTSPARLHLCFAGPATCCLTGHKACLGASSTERGVGLGPGSKDRQTWSGTPASTSTECSTHSPQPWGGVYMSF